MLTPLIRLAGLVVLASALVLSAGCGKNGKGYGFAPATTHLSASAQLVLRP